VGATLSVAVLGLGVALAVALLTASIAAMSRRASQAMSPFVLAQQTIPLVAIAPLVAGMIGEGTLALVLVTAWLCWFPAVIAMNTALRKVDAGAADVFRVAGATRWQTFARLQFPGAAAGLVAGVRASAGFALIGAIVAEYGAASHGLGAMIIRHVRDITPLADDTLFALVLTCAALGALVTWAAAAIARLALARWL
jgi:NitT/TauT family transport system permease protein